jgi:hypothetical protein
VREDIGLRIGLSGVALAALALVSCSKSHSAARVVCEPPTAEPPNELACTGLYADFDTKEVAKTARLYAPAVTFWSDGYEKSRWIELPDGQPIDTTDMDDWKFPVGTKVWKEFRFHDQKIETRLLWKVSDGNWAKASYVWSDDGSTATRGEGMSLTIAGAPYRVPGLVDCDDCHKGRKDTLLGFEAISLGQPAANGVTLAMLAQENRLAPAPSKTALTIDPGAATLHVNCGVSCHNSEPAANGHKSTLRLRIGFDEASSKPMASWQMLTTTVNVPATLPVWSGLVRIAPGAPDKSALLSSMKMLGTAQMPPNTTMLDFNGAAAVETFVRGLPPK